MFLSINERALPGFQSLVQSTGYERIDQALRCFTSQLGASKIRLAPHILMFDAAEYRHLVTAAHAILSAQQKIVQAVLKDRSRSDVLVAMGLDAELLPLVDWEQLANGRHRVARLDIIPTATGLAICEINFSAAVGGGELHNYYRTFADILQIHPTDLHVAPLDNLASMYAHSCRSWDIERLQLLDWSSHANLGYPSSLITEQHLRNAMPGMPIEIHDELSWKALASTGEAMDKTLIHRRFTYDDVTVNTEIYREMLESGARFSNGLEAELLMSKGWLSLLWQDRYRPLLDPEEISAIQLYLIPTFDLDKNNRSELMERRRELVFKSKNGYGGQNVILGKTMEADALWRTLASTGLEHWVYQPLVDAPSLLLSSIKDAPPSGHRVVLGLYVHDGRSSGIVTRSAPDTVIVNASSGACASWAPALDIDEQEHLLDVMRRQSI